MKKLLIVSAILCLACHTEQIDPPLRNGYLKVNLSIPDLSSFKAAVPECSSLEPNEIYYRLIRPSNGTIHEQTASLQIQGDEFTLTDVLTFLEGEYEVDEVSLRHNGMITHTAPSTLDPRFDFTRYVTNPLPYNLTIMANETTVVDNQVMCYTEEEIYIPPNFEWRVIEVELKTLYFFIDPFMCVSEVVIEIDQYEPFRITILENGLYSIPIPKDQTYYRVTMFGHEGEILRQVTGGVYNEDGNLIRPDLIRYICDY